MTENMKKFTEAVSGESEEFIKKMNQMSKEEIIALAKDKGITLTDADFENKEAEDGELSDDELSAAAGGAVCACAVGGGGTADTYDDGCTTLSNSIYTDDTCACVAYGQGMGHYTGRYADNGVGWVYGTKDYVRCVCVMGGGGESEIPQNCR